MTTAVPDLSSLMFGPRDSLSDRELRAVYDASSTRELRQGLNERMPGLPWSGIWGHIRACLPHLFQIPATEILAAAWEKHALLREAADEAKHPPGEILVVPMHKRAFTVTHHPRVELFFEGVKLDELEFDLDLELLFETLEVIVQGGRAIEARPGRCQGKATLALQGHRILSRRIGSVQWPGRIPLGQGIPLRDAAATETTSAGPPPFTVTPTASPQLPPVRTKSHRLRTFVFILLLAATSVYVGAGFDQWAPKLEGFWSHELAPALKRLLR
ncbi:hypothetical protein Thimo_1596 [Thioflavicoccus mobilis 8321]|uniref:Uncharacterized protein n=2 Tax=Thioflavicoccus mobilis TaxID=80679 RepID=L0GWM1_9GAMM|nr:hypothetical protein Thimo_1596 [Thioflavicoccus mobilis 8321]